ncbi:hypothetical protein T11_10043 [Trichinella zimbabwensis]|uniref:Uncharacterized protein n=1 Tax=Trichinella zimbabwensis TaxID=268475 RepID=A0A0V1GM95_9BILA|nr:hypothetical protein T11_10043 [Trichinella zimbabwensis]
MTLDRTRSLHICLVWGGGGRHQAWRKASTVVGGTPHRAVHKRMELLAGKQQRAAQNSAKFVSGKRPRARQLEKHGADIFVGKRLRTAQKACMVAGEKGSNVIAEKMASDKMKAIFFLRKWRRRTFKDIC